MTTQPPDLCSLDGQTVHLNLHPGQIAAWRSAARFVFVIAGFQSGKTTFGPWWLHREIMTRGPGDYLAVTASYDLFKLKMLPAMQEAFCHLLNWGTWQASDRIIVSHDKKSRIILRSAEARGGLESGTALAAWLDECGQDDFSLDAWEAVQRRLAINRGRALGTTTPYNLGWLKSQVFNRWVGGDADYDVVQFRSIDNPAFDPAEYERLRRTLPAWKFEMFCNGNFSRPAGMIYGDYDEAVHMIRPFSIPLDWKRYVGIDFGPVNTALIWLAEKPKEGEYYAYREKLGGELTGPQHAKEALEYHEPVHWWYGGSHSEDQQRRDWWLAGCPVREPGISDVEAGIDRVIGLFKQRRLFVFETLSRLRSELGTYSRELDDAGEPLERIANKDRFHLLDGLRYICSALPQVKPVVGQADVDAAWVKEQEERDQRRMERLRKEFPEPEIPRVETGW